MNADDGSLSPTEIVRPVPFVTVRGQGSAERRRVSCPVVNYGVGGKPSFWLAPPATGESNREIHVAVAAADRATVRSFDPDGKNVEAVYHSSE